MLLTLFGNVHEFDCYFLFRFFVDAQVDLAESTLANYLSHFVLIEDSTVVEFLSVQRYVENVLVLDELYVLFLYFKSVLIVELRTPTFLLTVESPARLFQNVAKLNAVSILNVYL